MRRLDGRRRGRWQRTWTTFSWWVRRTSSWGSSSRCKPIGRLENQNGWWKDESPRFLGMEVEKRGVDYVIHQQAYITNLLSEYEETGRGALGQVRTPEEEEQPTADQVLQAQKETGELLWVAGRS